MKKSYRVGVIGFAHMHINDLMKQFRALPNVDWVAFADTVPAVRPLSAKPASRRANMAHARETTGCDTVYDDYRTMLEQERFDIMLLCPENARRQLKVYTSRGANIDDPDQVLDGDPLPKGRGTLAEEFIHHLETGEPLHPTLDPRLNVDAVAILDAGIRSAASGKLELVDNEAWCTAPADRDARGA